MTDARCAQRRRKRPTDRARLPFARKTVGVGLVLAVVGCRRDHPAPPISADPAPRPSASASASSGPLATKPTVHTMKAEARGTMILIELQWPRIDLTGGGHAPSGSNAAAASASISNTIEDDLRMRAIRFERNWTSTMTMENAGDPSFVKGFFVRARCAPTLVASDFVSVFCRCIAKKLDDATWNDEEVWTYDWSIEATGTQNVLIEDIVGTSRVKKLAASVYADLKKQDAAFIKNGTFTVSSFLEKIGLGSFVVDGDGIVFAFSTGDVALTYEPGFRVLVDWNGLRAIAAEQNVIDRLESTTRDAFAIVAAPPDP